jgi:hypothetical protein
MTDIDIQSFEDPIRNLRHFTSFNVDTKGHNFPAARYESAANVCMSIGTLKGKSLLYVVIYRVSYANYKVQIILLCSYYYC